VSNSKKYFLVFLVLLTFLLIGNLLKATDRNEQNNVISKQVEEVIQSSIIVDIQGAIKNPGIYTINVSTRLFELVEKAGGLGDNYDKEYYTKNINPSVKLKDQQKIYIPMIGDRYLENMVNINSADLDTLVSKLGLSSANAKKIIGDRPYSNIEDLLNNGILTSKTYSQISYKIRI